MEIRDYQSTDLDALKTLHAGCGFDYQLPDLEAPSMVVKRLVVDEGQLRLAGFLRLTSEAFMLGDIQRWRTPAWRLAALKILHDDMRHKAQILMLDDVHCWIPPSIEKSFGKRLLELGWSKERPWPVFSQRLDV
jgi:hypothetical protein